VPFIFVCNQCGSTLHEDPSPALQKGAFKSRTYLETLFAKLNGTCPFCGHALRIPPLTVEVLVPEDERTIQRGHHKPQRNRDIPQEKILEQSVLR
jgi:hypothetical protein